MLGVASQPPACPPLPLRCLCTTGGRLWMWKTSQWRMDMMVNLHQRCRRGQKGLPLPHHHCHEEGEMGSIWRWLPSEGNRGSHTLQILLLGKAAASLGPGLRTWQGNFLAWYDPQTITHYWSSIGLERKTQSTVQEQSKKTSGSFWEKPLRMQWPRCHRGQNAGVSPSHSWIYDVSPKMTTSGLSERGGMGSFGVRLGKPRTLIIDN